MPIKKIIRKGAVSMGYGKLALVDAFKELVDMLVQAKRLGVDWRTISEAPEFTYVMTQKQFNVVCRICKDHGWVVPNIRGIHITLSAVEHVMSAREVKDGCSPAFIAEIMAFSYHEISQVSANRQHNSQALMFNTQKRLLWDGQRYHALAIVQVTDDGNGRRYLAPVTAYHASEAKIRGIQR